MGKIKILEPPTRTITPSSLKEDWLGIEVPLPTAEDFRRNPPISGLCVSSLARKNHLILKEAAADALERAGKKQAAAFLRGFSSDRYLFFPKDKCQLISE